MKWPYLARNEALSYSQGKYILFFDIDDYWLPEKLRRYKKIIDKNKTDLFFKVLKIKYAKKRFQFRSPNYWLFKNFINIYNPIPNCTACIKKELIKDIIFKPINHEDWMFWIDLLENNKNLKVFVDHKINSLYRIHEHSISYSKFKSIKWIILIYKRQGFNNIKILVFLIIRFLFIVFNLISDFFFYFYLVRLNRSIFRNIISDLELIKK